MARPERLVIGVDTAASAIRCSLASSNNLATSARAPTHRHRRHRHSDRRAKANAIAEQVIGTLRREGLDHIIVLTEQNGQLSQPGSWLEIKRYGVRATTNSPVLAAWQPPPNRAALPRLPKRCPHVAQYQRSAALHRLSFVRYLPRGAYNARRAAVTGDVQAPVPANSQNDVRDVPVNGSFIRRMARILAIADRMPAVYHGRWTCLAGRCFQRPPCSNVFVLPVATPRAHDSATGGD